MGKESSTISRRGFLKFAGKTAAVSAAFLSGCAQTSMQSAGRSAGGPARAIDIHHHYFPPELIDEIRPIGDQAAGVDEDTIVVDRGQLVAGRQLDDQVAMKPHPAAAGRD